MIAEKVLTAEGDELCMKCPRCGSPKEDEWHRIWECPDNRTLEHEHVRDTEHMAAQALEDRPHGCLWLRGLLPYEYLKPDPFFYADFDNCKPLFDQEFADIIRTNPTVGTDGGSAADTLK